MIYSLPTLKKGFFLICLLVSFISFSQERYVGATSLLDPDDMPQSIDLPAITSYEGMSYYFTKSVTLEDGFHVTGADGGFSILPLATNPPPSSSNNQNYVRVEVPSVEVASEYDLTNLDSDDKLTSYSYSDGVGRTIMASAAEAGPNYEDVIQYHHYNDETGRQDESYLPYAKIQDEPGQFIVDAAGDPNSKTETLSFYDTPTDPTVESDNTPYSTTEFDTRGRVKSVIAPGDVYHNAERKTSYEYKMQVTGSYIMHDLEATVHVVDAPVIRWVINGEEPEVEGYYGDNVLSLAIVKDAEGKISRVVKDVRGLTITSQLYDPTETRWVGTYNVYDDFGRVRFTIPQAAVNTVPIEENLPDEENWSLSPDQIDELLFQYEYDKRGRVTRTKAPGAGWIETVYDIWDRPVLSRHETMKLEGAVAWHFVKYDALNRPIITGLIKESDSREDLQTILDGRTDRYEERASGEHGYILATSFPKLGTNQDYSYSNYQIQTVNYFDNYGFLNHSLWDREMTNQSDFGKALPMGFSANQLSSAVDRPTGSKTLILGTNKYLNTVIYYDEDGRVLQTVSENHLGGIDRVTNDLEWNGQLNKMLLEHSGEEDVAILSEYQYDDHTGQLLKTFQNIADSYQTMTSSTKVEVADYHYNILGELVEKNLHSTNGISYLQSVDYRFNIQGALKSINQTDLNAGSDNDLFGMEYNYTASVDIVKPGGATETIAGRYDGLVSSVEWNATTNTAENDFTKSIVGYNYDERNRLAETHYATKAGSTWSGDKGFFNTSITEYDDNGNIENLSRKSDGDDMDDLHYTYSPNSNKLKNVGDASGEDGGFEDYYPGATDYAYDAMGNMTSDMNKQITSIEYNQMQYVTKIQFGDGTHIINTYDAVGNRLSKEVKDGDDNTIGKVDYVGLVEYLDEEINQVFTSEGWAFKQNGQYHYEYFIKDHQENTRVAFGNMPERNVYTATMESNRSNYEDSHFTIPAGVRHQTLPTDNDNKNHTPLGKWSAELNAQNPSRGALGPAKVLTIAPGDEVELEVWAKYTDGGWNNSVINNIASLIHAAYGVASVGTGGEGASSNVLSELNGGDQNIFGKDKNQAGAPEAYLQYLFFDANYNFVSSKSKFISVDDQSNGYYAKLATDAPLEFDEAGYLFVYVANESNQNKEVYFDDLKITHSSATASFKVSQVNEYYPYGMPTSNSWRAPGYVDPGLLYQSSYASYDSLSGYYDFLSRSYDPAIGRFFQVDPAAQYSSPYKAMGNNPHMMVDPNGEWAGFAIGAILGALGHAGSQSLNGNGSLKDNLINNGLVIGGGYSQNQSYLSAGTASLGTTSRYNFPNQGSAIFGGFAPPSSPSNYNLPGPLQGGDLLAGAFGSDPMQGSGNYNFLGALNQRHTFFPTVRPELDGGGSGSGGRGQWDVVCSTCDPVPTYRNRNSLDRTVKLLAYGTTAFGLGNTYKELLINTIGQASEIAPATARYLKYVRGAGIIGGVATVGISSYNIYNDYSQGGWNAVNGWDIADAGAGVAGVGAAVFLASNPIGWAIAGGSALYFAGRLVHDLYYEPIYYPND